MRLSIYAGSFIFTLFSTCLNLISLNRRDWILYKAPVSTGLSLKTVWGLFETCNYGIDGQRQCREFPIEGIDCRRPESLPGEGWHKPFTFCDHYRTAGYAAQLAAVFGLAALISHIIIVARGRHFRNHGWKMLCGFIFANAICQIITSIYVATLVHNYTAVFTQGSRVTTGFVMSQISWGTDVLLFVSLLSAGIVHTLNGSPDGYREIPGTPKSRRSRRWSNESTYSAMPPHPDQQ